jgi:hypothetical protein
MDQFIFEIKLDSFLSFKQEQIVNYLKVFCQAGDETCAISVL